MRLAIFTSQFPGRVNTFFARDVRGLLDAGVAVDVFALYPETPALWRHVPPILSESRFPRDRVRYVGLWPGWAKSRPAGALGRVLPAAAAVCREAVAAGPTAFAKSLYTALKSWNFAAVPPADYDHVLGYWGNYAATAAYLFVAAGGFTRPYSIFLHAGTDLYRDRFFLRQKLEAARHIIVCSEFNRDFLAETYPDLGAILGARLYVHQHGLDLAELPFDAGPRPAERIVGVGGLEKAKGFDVLLRSAAVLRARGLAVEVELVGDGPERGALERLVHTLGLDGAVHLRGWLPFAQARDAIARASVLVHPSIGLGDGAPNVIKEAMALGTPVVASSVAGIPGLLEDGRCGVLVPPRDAVGLADALASLREDESRRASIAERARRSAESRFDLWANGRALAERLRQPGRAAGAS